MKIEVVHSLEGFEQLAPVWKALQEECNLDNPFLTYEFFYCLVKVFFANHELLVFVVRDEGEVVAIAPFVRETGSIRSINNIHSHYFDFLTKADGLDVYAFVFRYLLRHYEFERIHLGDVARKSRLYEYIASSGLFLYALAHERPSPVLTITGDWDGYYRAISKNFRENYRKRVNKVTRHGGYEYKACSEPGELDAFLNDLFYIEKNSWKHSVGRSMFSNAEQTVFYALLAKEFFDHVKIELLYIDGAPAAFWLSLFYGGTVYQLKNSFVEEYKDFSPGVILTLDCLKGYFEQKVKCVDYLGVTNTVKEKVSNDFWLAYDVNLYRKTLAKRVYFLIKFKVWPRIGNSEAAQSIKNFILRRSPAEKVDRKAYQKK